MLVASRTVVIRLPSNAYENTRTPSADRNDVSRACKSRSELRRHISCRGAHDGNFLPADVHGKKAGARECEFLRYGERSVGGRLSSLFALSSDRAKHTSSETARALAQ